MKASYVCYMYYQFSDIYVMTFKINNLLNIYQIWFTSNNLRSWLMFISVK